MSNIPESLHQLIRDRRSGRAFTDQPIDHDTLTTLLEAARWAPSCGNRQPWRYVMTTQPESLSALQEALTDGNVWAKKAPALLTVISHEDFDNVMPDGRKYYLFDTGLGTQNLLIQATAMGLMCHPMAGFDPAKARQALNIPDDYEVICLIAIGYPGDPELLEVEKLRARETAPRVRKPLDAIANFETWSEKLENPDRE